MLPWWLLIGLTAGAATANRQLPRLDMSTEFFLVPSGLPKTTPAPIIIASRRPPIRLFPTAAAPPAENHTVLTETTGPTLRKEPWSVPLLASAGVTMALIAGFEIFVICKAWRTSPSHRHLFLGQVLLLGLFMCAGLGAVAALTPTTASCATLRFGVGLSFTIVFAALLVKTVFLISLNTGVYLPAPYQALLLLFAILIQVVLGVQWLFNSPPRVDHVPPDLPLCHTTFSEHLLSLLYVVFLILFVAILAVKSRGIRDNYREAVYICVSIWFVVPLWIGWSGAGLLLPLRHRDACLGFGLVTTSFATFLAMFLPKGRQLAALGKDGLYVEDRDDRFSSLSSPNSGYSPSFFHFKPVNYGVVGEKKAPIMPGVGDRVALVAAPPSYTRMYHCYPPLYSLNVQNLSTGGYYPPRYSGAQLYDPYTKSTFTATRYHNHYFANTPLKH